MQNHDRRVFSSGVNSVKTKSTTLSKWVLDPWICTILTKQSNETPTRFHGMFYGTTTFVWKKGTLPVDTLQCSPCDTGTWCAMSLLIMDVIGKWLGFGCALCPDSLIVRLWFMMWYTKVALRSFERIVLAWLLWPRLPLSLPRALPTSMLGKFSKWLNWVLFYSGLIGIQFKYFQFNNVCSIWNRCGTLRFDFWTKRIMYEIAWSVQEQVCCKKKRCKCVCAAWYFSRGRNFV